MRIAKLIITMAVTVAATAAVADPACNMRKGSGRFASTTVQVQKVQGLPVLAPTTTATAAGNQ